MSLSSKITSKRKGELVRTLCGTFPVKPSLVPQSWSECFSKHSDDFVKAAYAPGEEQSACLKVFGQIAAQGKPSRAGYGSRRLGRSLYILVGLQYWQAASRQKLLL